MNRQKKKTATIFDVAKMADVSIKTVSRVINNEPNVRDKTRAKVLAAVSKLNYLPNSSARGLSGKRSYVIGLVYENPHEFSYIKGVLNGALATCDAHGYSLLLRPLTLPDKSLINDIRQFALKTKLDGIVLTAPICDMQDVKSMLAELDIPCAIIGPKDVDLETISISCDEENASLKLTEYVLSLGHTRIGFVKGHPDHGASHKRLKGYRRGLKNHGIRFDPGLVRQGYFDFESGQSAGHKLLNMSDRPSAIIASNDDMAAGVVFEAHELGLSIPGEVSIVGFDDISTAGHMWPPLTTVRQPISEMSARATELLIAQLRGGDPIVSEESFGCEIIIRSSAGSWDH